MSKVKDIYVDADHMIYYIALARDTKAPKGFDEIEGEGLGDGKLPLKPFKKRFKALIEDYYQAVEIESILYKWKPGKIHLIFSDPNGNFRYDMYPEYKSRDQTQKTELFYRLRKWAHKKYGVAEGLEADDVVGHYARKGHIVVTTDKDVFKGCPGTFYNSHMAHKSWVRTTPEEAHRFNLLQTLAGDDTDSIPGLPGVALGTAEKLLGDDHTWEAVVRIYRGEALHDGPPFFTKAGKESAVLKRIRAANLGEDDAVLTRRLIGLDQWTPKKGLKLWEPKV